MRERRANKRLFQALLFFTSEKNAQIISRLAPRLLDGSVLKNGLEQNLSHYERACLSWLLEGGGVRPWNEVPRMYGDNLSESTYWIINPPQSIPGRLKCYGLLFTGTIEDRQVALIPVDLRPLLREALAGSS